MTRMKLLLLHGWDWRKYPVFAPRHQWENRQEFLDRLQEYYEVDFPILPGFGGEDARRKGAWTLDDYAAWLQEQVVNGDHDAIVGYSFGCAVVARWQRTYQRRSVRMVLVSPAIARAYMKRPPKALGRFVDVSKRLMPAGLVRWLRTIYLTHWIKNPFVIHGSPFLRSTYSNIVGLNLSDDIRELLQTHFKITLIFGSEDTATPPGTLLHLVPEARAVTLLIHGGTHDIGSTHGRELVAHIVAAISPSESER